MMMFFRLYVRTANFANRRRLRTYFQEPPTSLREASTPVWRPWRRGSARRKLLLARRET